MISTSLARVEHAPPASRLKLAKSSEIANIPYEGKKYKTTFFKVIFVALSVPCIVPFNHNCPEN